MAFWMIVAFLFILGPLLFLHELGHFWAAKVNGIAVEEFGFGLGPKLTTLFRRDGTDYTIRAIPFAAFVRIAGEEDPSLAEGMMNAPRRTRFLISAAGPTMNIVAVLVILWIAYLFGPPAFTRVVLTHIEASSPAEAAGLLPQDIVLQVDAIEVSSTADFGDYTATRKGQPVTLLVERNDDELEVVLTPRKDGEYDPRVEGPIGVGMRTVDAGPADSQNVFEAAGSAIREFADYVEMTAQFPGMLVRAIQAKAENAQTGAPIAPEEDLRNFRPVGIFGILQLIGATLQAGVTEGYWFYIFRVGGFISMALGTTNLLPLPGMDGGRILFVILDWLSEKILHRRINPEREVLIHALGIMVLLVLMVVITWQDIANPLIQFPSPTPSSTPIP